MDYSLEGDLDKVTGFILSVVENNPREKVQGKLQTELESFVDAGARRSDPPRPAHVTHPGLRGAEAPNLASSITRKIDDLLPAQSEGAEAGAAAEVRFRGPTAGNPRPRPESLHFSELAEAFAPPLALPVPFRLPVAGAGPVAASFARPRSGPPRARQPRPCQQPGPPRRPATRVARPGPRTGPQPAAEACCWPRPHRWQRPV